MSLSVPNLEIISHKIIKPEKIDIDKFVGGTARCAICNNKVRLSPIINARKESCLTCFECGQLHLIENQFNAGPAVNSENQQPSSKEIGETSAEIESDS